MPNVQLCILCVCVRMLAILSVYSFVPVCVYLRC